jgi:hypothetical protein
MRAGLGPRHPLSRAAVADRLDINLRAVRRTERRGMRSLRATARGGCGSAGSAADPALRTTAFHLGAARNDHRGGGVTGTATGHADEPGRGGVKDEFRSGPGGAPGATLTPPPLGGGDGGPPVLPLIALGFLVGFAAVWVLERRRAYA